MIENLVHFIYPAWDNTRPLSLVNYVAVARAKAIQKPDKILFWIDKEPIQNEWWERIKSLVEVRHIEMSGEYEGVKIEWPQLQSDVTRLEILIKHGGIYLDTDMLLLKPLDEWFHFNRFGLCFEPGNASICNALMMGPPDSAYAKALLREMPEALKSETWADSGVLLPFRVAQENPYDSMVLPYYTFCPFDLKTAYMFEPDQKAFCEFQTTHSNAAHVYETYWRDVVKNVTRDFVKNTDCFFSDLARGTLD